MADSTGREVHLGHVWAAPNNRSDKEETDHWLEYDPDDDTYQILVHHEVVSGPKVSTNRHRITLLDYLKKFPDRKVLTDKLIEAGKNAGKL